MTQTALEARRLGGKFVLFFVLCWVVVLISGISGAARGTSYEALNVVIALLPGLAFVPAGYYAVRLHTTSDADQVTRIWPRTLILGILGLVLLFAATYGIYVAGQS